ncbi:MAG: hypothetical protein O7A04_06770 [Acidobacteria bacterium]|nr:hypothetical protein [Acidobacteriota bacterium]
MTGSALFAALLFAASSITVGGLLIVLLIVAVALYEHLRRSFGRCSAANCQEETANEHVAR